MPRIIRFHLDEHMDPAVAAGLLRRGIEVSTSTEAGLLGADDSVQLAYAFAEQRVLCTSDSDFLNLHGQGILHPASPTIINSKSPSVNSFAALS